MSFGYEHEDKKSVVSVMVTRNKEQSFRSRKCSGFECFPAESMERS